jgi:hypothetical protein
MVTNSEMMEARSPTPKLPMIIYPESNITSKRVHHLLGSPGVRSKQDFGFNSLSWKE